MIEVAVGIALTIVVAAIVIAVHKRQRITLRGAVIRLDADPNKQTPIAGVQIAATTIGSSTASNAKSDSTGFFSLTLPRGFRRRQAVTLRLQHPDFQPVELQEYASDKLYIVRMAPIPHKVPAAPGHPDIAIANIRVRYSTKTTTEPDVGSAVKTFQVVNTGSVPCHNSDPCSPRRQWKASLGSTTLDAGEGFEFRNVRVSCIAGPCPFTKIEDETLLSGGRYLHVAALDWSDTTTFLVEAEVVHPMESDIVRESYPVIFGQTLNFSLPAAAEGPSIEAEVNGEPIVFPLGPDLLLSWAHCTQEIARDQGKIYRCELSAGYQFR